MKRIKVLNVVITVLITLWFIYLGIMHFSSSYLRLFESLGDLWMSIKFFFVRVLRLEKIVIPSVNRLSKVLTWDIRLADDFSEFNGQFSRYVATLLSSENLAEYGLLLSDILMGIAKGIVIAIPCYLVLRGVIKRMYRSNNVNHNQDSVPLKTFKWIKRKGYEPIARYVKGYIAFLSRYMWICFAWVVLWVIQFNFATILVAFFAYIMYLFATFQFETLYLQFYKLIIDLQVFVRAFPKWFLVFIAVALLNRARKGIALSKLRYMEARNCGFINELPIVSMACGSMGRKKTTMITDMALSQEVMFRQKAFELIRQNDMKFPFFPWIRFEMDLRKCIEYGAVYNLATVKEWIKKKRERYERNGDERKRLYGYDIEKYGAYYDDGLRVWNLFDILSVYAQLYFMYLVESSLIVSNYSIREDNLLLDQGNFPMWATDFFPDGTTNGGYHSHILDFDVLRLGKKVKENNPNAGSFEFGVVVISEVGKERGNNLELREVKKKTEETNQKNDLFNGWLKMCRHSATVDNFPFIKVFTDEQRPESWGADAREMADVINIVSSTNQKLALPFYIYEEMITEIIFNRFIGLYYDFRYRRGDNTLLIHLLKSVACWLFQRNKKIYNRYGYSILRIEKERGTLDDKIERKKYFILNKKIYSKRFSTDCFSDYFNEMARNTKVGLRDYVEYMDERASVEELRLQNSYFMNSLYKDSGDNEAS